MMKPTIPVLGLALALGACATAPQEGAPPATVSALAPDAANAKFEAFGQAYLTTIAAANPILATQLGNHDHDSEVPDVSTAGRERELAEARALLARLQEIDKSRLTPDNQVDYALLDNALRYQIFEAEELQEWAWNPQYYNDIASYALYSLVARDFAPWPQRLNSAIDRMEKLPALLAEARRQIVVSRVPKVHAEIVSQQNAGILEIVDGVLVPELDKADDASRTRFDAALDGLKAAIAEHQKWLDEQVVPNATGDFRLGTALYDKKMRFGLMSPLSRQELKGRALKAKADTRAEMFELSKQILAERGVTLPAQSDPAQLEQATIEAALAISYEQKPARDRLERRVRETLAEATEFTRQKGFIRMPDGAVQVITMPKFWQGNAVAYDDAPGPLERNLPNYIAVSPIPDDWTDEQANSFLTEYNDFMLHDLAIHEGVPGHYLQLDHANREESMIRAVLSSSPFAEGWAVYAEGVMADEGYLGGDPLFKLTVLKMRLRSITNTLLDIGIHTEGMSREEAMDLMMKGAFQQEREAAGKWTRANLSSVQLLSYFTGYTEHLDMRREAERRWGDEFTLRRYHDTVLSHGSPPVKYVRALVFGEKVD